MTNRRLQSLQEEYQRPDHWNYKSDPYELLKYDQTLALVPPGRYARVLEVGCSEGVFTRRLAPLADDILGLDLVPVALERAQRECADLANVRFRRFDLEVDDLQLQRDQGDQRFDLIFCAEVLYYLRWTRLRPVTRKIASWLKPGGYLIAVHAKSEIVVTWEFGPKGADRTHKLFERPGMRRLHDQDEGEYVLTLFQKVEDVRTSRWQALWEDVRGQDYPNLAWAVLRRGRAWLRRQGRRR
ncbi:MAG: nodulation S family protein [Chloroflexota bacterium]|nr:nodulation S family protein [Chloroflexota bacterium]